MGSIASASRASTSPSAREVPSWTTVFVPERPLSHYQEQARESRPEVLALTHLVASKRALADLERRKQYPDLVLLGSATYANASSIDDPQNAFLNDPFNTTSAGLAAAIRMPLDLGVRNARAAQVRASDMTTLACDGTRRFRSSRSPIVKPARSCGERTTRSQSASAGAPSAPKRCTICGAASMNRR